MKLSAKDLLQKAWVLEVGAVILYTMAAVIGLKPEQVRAWIESLPLLTTLIGGQGIFAAAGPEIRRWIESRKNGEG